jgi:hypothetical protein
MLFFNQIRSVTRQIVVDAGAAAEKMEHRVF